MDRRDRDRAPEWHRRAVEAVGCEFVGCRFTDVETVEVGASPERHVPARAGEAGRQQPVRGAVLEDSGRGEVAHHLGVGPVPGSVRSHGQHSGGRGVVRSNPSVGFVGDEREVDVKQRDGRGGQPVGPAEQRGVGDLDSVRIQIDGLPAEFVTVGHQVLPHPDPLALAVGQLAAAMAV